MSITIVDKRKVSRDRMTENRARFIRRIRETIKEQLPDIVNGRSLKEMDASGGKIRVSRKTIHEPKIIHTDGGNVDRVLPGNDEYVTGDQILKPPKNSDAQQKASDDPTLTEDDFIVELSREEFLDAYLEDLELPDMVQSQITKIKSRKRENSGFQPDGPPNRLNVQRSYKQSFARRLTVTGALKTNLEEVEFMLAALVSDDISDEARQEISDLEAEAEELRGAIGRKLPLFEETDLRYRAVTYRDVPVAHATMIMVMDNSGSMGAKEKTIARKFFWLLYSFLTRTYESVDMRFVSHTTSAREMEEEEFFNTRESGGTVVSSALDLTSQIIDEVGDDTNVYVAQVSDGDNFDTDNGTCSEILEDSILPRVRYMAYVQVDNYHDEETGTTPGSLMNLRGLWRTYQSVSDKMKNLAIARVYSEKDIFQVFRDLFKKKDTHS